MRSAQRLARSVESSTVLQHAAVAAAELALRRVRKHIAGEPALLFERGLHMPVRLGEARRRRLPFKYPDTELQWPFRGRGPIDLDEAATLRPGIGGVSRGSVSSRTGQARAPRVRVRGVQMGDLDQVIAIDAEITRLRKPAYWRDIFARYGSGRRQQRFFLVAEAGATIQGFVIGEVRDWEFGSPRCGWVFAISVRPGARQAGTGSRLLAAICTGFKKIGVTTVRTMLSRDNNLILSFFRSQGMMAARFIPLEMDLGEP